MRENRVIRLEREARKERSVTKSGEPASPSQNLPASEYKALYGALFQAQGGVCWICGRPPKRGRKLHMDHDHATGKIRGLLCTGCNFGLGCFQDDPARFLRAIEYLSRRP